jgi:hypothetical protein
MAEIDGIAVRFEDLTSPIATSAAPVTVLEGIQPRTVGYSDGLEDGERYGFSSQREQTMEPIALGETDPNKRTISFHLYTSTGLPASGLTEEGPICSPAAGQIQANRDLAGYVNATGTLSHVGDGNYRYTFSAAEVAAPGGEGNVWLRIRVPGFRSAVFRTPIRVAVPSQNEIRDAILNAARSGFLTGGTIGEGVAIGTAMIQGNFLMDTVTNTTDGQTVSRVRCFLDGATASAATAGGSSEGEFATFTVTTTYSGPNKVVTHRVVKV